MTQVEKLITGAAAPKAGSESFLKRGQSDLVLEQFASIMNQSAGNLPGRDLSFTKPKEDMSGSIFSLGDASAGVRKDYAKFSQGVRSITEAKQGTVNAADFGQKVSDLAQKVEESIRETMQVSEEEFGQVMESLGFSPMDLLDPQNLIQLVQGIFGSDDVSALLVDANFQMMLEGVNGLIQGFQQENGLDAGAFSDLLAQLSAQIDQLEEAVAEMLQTGEASPGQLEEQFNQFLEEAFGAGDSGEETAEMPVVSEEAVIPAQMQNAATEGEQPLVSEENVQEQTAVPVVGEAAEDAQTDDGADDMLSNANGGKQEKTFASHMEDPAGNVTEHAPVFREAQIPLNVQTVPQAEVPQAAFSYLEVEQLMNQMEGLARAFASAEGTTLEMQLNPESLGRLFLTVTEKQGAVTAQIAASNEQVKEALQTQMVELRATLQAQGLKVEAVEVTVATHEFEQNLDGNTSANGHLQQEQAERQAAGNGQGGRRNLNLNNLDELSGLMSEEEALVAQMMRDNGGTVDYIA